MSALKTSGPLLSETATASRPRPRTGCSSPRARTPIGSSSLRRRGCSPRTQVSSAANRCLPPYPAAPSCWSRPASFCSVHGSPFKDWGLLSNPERAARPPWLFRRGGSLFVGIRPPSLSTVSMPSRMPAAWPCPKACAAAMRRSYPLMGPRRAPRLPGGAVLFP